jgi:NADPH:quinone reductase-like Zn-dependent oxidoreductase
MMKSAVLQSSEGIDTIRIVECDVPEPGPGQALVRLTAATLNYRDLIMAKGLIPGIAKAPELIPLSCASGVVEAVGPGVDRVQAGDRVMPIFTLGWIDGPQESMEMLGGSVDGVARQYAVFPADSLVHLPDELGDFDGATFACAGLTAWSALTQFRPTGPGDWILAHGTGGVSIAALQLAKAMGANVAITSSSDAKLNRAKALGAHVTVNYRTANWADAVRQAIGGNRVANVIDTVGTAQFEDNAALLADAGQISGIGMLGSDFSWTRPDATDVLQPIGVGDRTQHEAMTTFIVEHRIRPVVDLVYDLDRLADAYRALESGTFFGKVGINLR